MRKFLLIVILLSTLAYGIKHADAKDGWTEETYKKEAKMVRLGFSEDLAEYVINVCKSESKNPERCVITAAFIGKNESNSGRNANKCNSVFGVKGCYRNKYESVDKFVEKFDKYWYRQKTPDAFYSNTPKRKPVTFFCMSEDSSGSQGFCPNGHKTAWFAFNIISK